MKAMQCDRASELIGAYLDQELDADTRREVAVHLGACTACTDLVDDLRGMSRLLTAIGRELPSEHLVSSVRARLAGAEVETTLPHRLARAQLSWGPIWLRQAVALLLVCIVTAAATALLLSRATSVDTLERD